MNLARQGWNEVAVGVRKGTSRRRRRKATRHLENICERLDRNNRQFAKAQHWTAASADIFD